MDVYKDWKQLANWMHQGLHDYTYLHDLLTHEMHRHALVHLSGYFYIEEEGHIFASRRFQGPSFSGLVEKPTIIWAAN